MWTGFLTSQDLCWQDRISPMNLSPFIMGVELRTITNWSGLSTSCSVPHFFPIFMKQTRHLGLRQFSGSCSPPPAMSCHPCQAIGCYYTMDFITWTVILLYFCFFLKSVSISQDILESLIFFIKAKSFYRQILAYWQRIKGSDGARQGA